MKKHGRTILTAVFLSLCMLGFAPTSYAGYIRYDLDFIADSDGTHYDLGYLIFNPVLGLGPTEYIWHTLIDWQFSWNGHVFDPSNSSPYGANFEIDVDSLQVVNDTTVGASVTCCHPITGMPYLYFYYELLPGFEHVDGSLYTFNGIESAGLGTGVHNWRGSDGEADGQLTYTPHLVVPSPNTLLLIGISLLSLGWMRHTKPRKASPSR